MTEENHALDSEHSIDSAEALDPDSSPSARADEFDLAFHLLDEIPNTIDRSGPTNETDRIVSLDVLRGFALMGILVVNIHAFAMPVSAYFNPGWYDGLEGWNGVVWLVGRVFFERKFMAIFSMLFGAGIVLMAERRDTANRPVLRLHFRRMILLLIFGLIHAYGIWFGDILISYAVCGCCVVWFRKWPAHLIIIIAVDLILIGSLHYYQVGYRNTEILETTRVMQEPSYGYQRLHEAETRAYLGTWEDHLPWRKEEVTGILTYIFPRVYFWRICGLMLLGMALYKWKILDASRSPLFYAAMAILCGGIGLPFVLYGVHLDRINDFHPAYLMGFGRLHNYYSGLGVALMWIALIMLICRTRALPFIRKILAAYGQMAFTNYIGQTLIATYIFYGYGLGLFGTLDRAGQLGVVLIIWAIQLALSPIWLKFFQFGPLEWLWRTGAYLKFQPILRRD